MSNKGHSTVDTDTERRTDPRTETDAAGTVENGAAPTASGDSPPAGGAPVLKLDGLRKSYATEPVVEGLSLSVREGEILTLLGPSGCGKTTTLRLIAGLERPDGGAVRINGESVSGSSFVAPEDRGVGVVFQEFALFPHLTARENVAFGLKDRPDDEVEARVGDLLELVDLGGQGDSYPDQLSGGQQQRVALARSLAPEPDILLLDEPFSNLDVDLRVEMREEVREIIKRTGVTAVSVTHDQEEALSISDRVAVMTDGRIEQIGEPETVFQHPESRFVAAFLGYASFVPGYVSGDIVETDLGTVPREQIHGLAREYDHTRIDLLVRPDDVSARPVADAADGCGRVVGRRYLGPTFLYEVELDTGESIQCMHNHDENIPTSGPVDLALEADHELAWFPREQRPEDDSRYGS
ncbi:ABC transporter ATP-binding protein [Halobellus salinus]|uniref:Molybdate/tungstate import ATP-binding protein WtpC n=1 Tax=Halobellus salinus TaxID=931585 RepID=A0A830ECM2_9EURY|nr:ABC transporter ATP-binding protein [Halobellus salinus]GGI98915.1 ABC transporter ATP-binding protein [Halobellus salinus]SMP05502.1 iron(III) transport system ATP-binding protein [Halobellus salinus]